VDARPTKFEDDAAPERSLIVFFTTIYKDSSPTDLLFETSAKCRERSERGQLVRVLFDFELAGEPPTPL
jgi:hypothetical protein